MQTQQCKYSLSLTNHKNNIMQNCKAYYVNGFHCDVTLACGGMSLKAHKVVLAAGSPFFHSIFLEFPEKHPVIIVKDMHFLDVKTALEFMYEGQATVFEDQICELKRIAHAFEIKGLSYLLKDFKEDKDLKTDKDSKSAQSNKRRRKRRRNTTASSDVGGTSEKSDNEIEVMNMIYKKSPSSPLENTDEPSSLLDQTTEGVSTNIILIQMLHLKLTYAYL